MTHDDAVALSLLDDLPRVDLTARLLADDPHLLERAAALVPAAREARARADAQGIHVLPWTDSRYPASLLATSDAPPALWYRGDPAALDALRVAIVGSRAASTVAREIATALAHDLAAHGVTVVSGLARGVDSAAHRGALSGDAERTGPAGGRTIAVLGSGVDRIYPAEHDALAAGIAVSGLVMSEYPPGTPPLQFHFPMRNRIISGLSRAVVVIEAHEKSGSLITAACALEQGREVMAVPGTVVGGRNRGGHALIRDGATIVESAADILDALGMAPMAARKGPPCGDDVERGFTPRQATTSTDPVLGRMEPGHPYDLDALAAVSGMDVHKLLPYIMDLELTGRLRRLDGGRFLRPA